MNVLVAGGAGYVGSHAVKALQESGHTPVVLDTLELGHEEACSGAELVVGNTADKELVTRVLREFSIDTVMHFAAYSRVGESMELPVKYYVNNVASTLLLIESMLETGVNNFIFSSTAATYGEPESMPICEDTPRNPINPYGHSKLEVEEACAWIAGQTDFSFTAFRYFNACGAHPSGLIGEDHQDESHLIPLILQVPLGQRESIKIFGTDYPTPDGTCIRDYIHVSDLADAHIKGMEYLAAGGESTVMNLGTGNGYSVRQIIDTAKEVTEREIPAEEVARRAGDPPELVARAERARQLLDWKPTQSDLKTIISTAWQWHRVHPKGYG